MSSSTLTMEGRALLSTLNTQRDHVLGILDGLPEEALRRPVLPSGWTCLGLVQHLAIEVERFWFRAVVDGDHGVLEADGPGNAWQVSAGTPVEAVFDRYRQEIGIANGIIIATPTDAPPAWWPEELFGSWRLDNLREILLHVITETACHAGHLDAARELIDGRTWMVLP